MSEPLVILGASARAAAFSAQAAGYSPACADMFADTDLARQAKALKVPDYPHGLVAAAQDLPPGPWMYTGALENHPELVDRLALERGLYGNNGEVLRRIRDPFSVQRELMACGLNFPPTERTCESVPRDGTWLCKPYRSSGGDHIVPWTENVSAANTAIDMKTFHERFFFQERKEGTPCAAVYVAAGGQASLLGVTQQIIGAHWAGVSGFCYAGSIGPLRLTTNQQACLEEVGQRIAERFHLVGLFGVDFLAANNELCVIEVNPRYPASAEILERAIGISAVGSHVAACTREVLASPTRSNGECSGKAIVFSERELAISPSFVVWASTQNARLERYVVADIPGEGTLIPAGAPIATVLADGQDSTVVKNQLQSLATELRASLS